MSLKSDDVKAATDEGISLARNYARQNEATELEDWLKVFPGSYPSDKATTVIGAVQERNKHLSKAQASDYLAERNRAAREKLTDIFAKRASSQAAPSEKTSNAELERRMAEEAAAKKKAGLDDTKKNG